MFGWLLIAAVAACSSGRLVLSRHVRRQEASRVPAKFLGVSVALDKALTDLERQLDSDLAALSGR